MGLELAAGRDAALVAMLFVPANTAPYALRCKMIAVWLHEHESVRPVARRSAMRFYFSTSHALPPLATPITKPKHVLRTADAAMKCVVHSNREAVIWAEPFGWICDLTHVKPAHTETPYDA
jgi:hypothetical protein